MSTKRLALIGVMILLAWVMPITVHAMAVAPATIEAEFYSNEDVDYNFELINNEDQSIDVELSTDGELASYVKFGDKKFTMTPWESKIITFTVKYPKEMSLPNMIPIVVTTPIKTKTGATLNAKVALELRLMIRGEHTVSKEIETLGIADVDIVDVTFENVNAELAKLNIKVKNVGEVDTDVSAEVSLGKGEYRQLVKIDPVKLRHGSTETLTSFVQVPDITGYYDAEITLRYGDRIIKEFFKLQILERQTAGPVLIYVVIGMLIAFNVVLIGLLFNRMKKRR